MSEFEKPAVVDEATWPTHKHGEAEHRHRDALEGHVHGLHSTDAVALDLTAEIVGEALKGEFGTFIQGSDETWKRAALGVLTKIRGEITSGGEGVAILTLRRA